MAKNTQHIVKSPDGGWAVRKGGSSKATKIHVTQKGAIDHGRAIAKGQGAELYIHSKDGRIREKDSYARDPLPAKSGRNREKVSYGRDPLPPKGRRK